MVRKLLIIVPVILALTVVSLFMPAQRVTIEGIGRLSFETAVTLSVGQEPAYASPGWLSGWAKRVKITIDSADIDENLTHFPVLIHLSSACGKGGIYDLTPVFDEVGGNYKRIAVTKADEVTQLYVEIEKWDATGEEAWLWVSKSDWTISSASATDIYLYYDNSQDDNTFYVGDSGSRTEVWDGDFKAVWHLSETSGFSSIAVDEVSSGSGTGNTITVSHPTSGTNRLMLVGISTAEATASVSSIQYGGVDLSLVGESVNTDAEAIWIYKLVAPAAGVANLVVTFSTAPSNGATVGVVTFTGVDQSTPLGTFAGAVGNTPSTPATVDVSSALGELVFDTVFFYSWYGEVTVTAGTGQTQRWNLQETECRGAGSTKPGAATVTMSWDASPAETWAIGAVPIKPVSTTPDPIKDSTLNANHLTNTGCTFGADGKIGKGIDLNGSSDILDRADADLSAGFPGKSGTTVSEFTAELWFNVDVVYSSDVGALITKVPEDGFATAPFDSCVDGWESPQILNWAIGGTEHYEAGKATIAIDTWYYAVFRYSDTEDYMRQYLQAVEEVAAIAKSGNLPTNAQAFTLGKSLDIAEDRFFDGIIDEVRISDSARTAAWVKASYESERDDLLDFGSKTTIQPGPTAGIDTQVGESGWSEENTYGSASIVIEYGSTTGWNMLIRWDLSSIPSGSTVTSAIMTLYKTNTQSWRDNSDLVCYEITDANGDWQENQVCYSYKHLGDQIAWAGSAGCNTAGTDYNSTSMGTFEFERYVAGSKDAALDTSVVEGWCGQATNNGMILRTADEAMLHIATSDHSTASYRPKLVVNYTPPPAAWLNCWAKRVKITIDSADIDSDLTHFPVLIHLSSACGIGGAYNLTPVFDEVGGNSKRIAVTKADGETQLYVEIEKWDATGQEAWLWVSRSDWTISSTTDTDIYLYYDNSQPDNTTYVGDTGDTPAQDVWDDNFVGVWDLGEGYSTATDFYKDSTGNNNHGTLTDSDGDSQAIEGQVNGALDFNGDADSINTGSGSSLDNIEVKTVSAWASLSYIDQANPIATKGSDDEDAGWYFYIDTEADRERLGFIQAWSGATAEWHTDNFTVTLDTIHHVVVVYNRASTANDPVLYIDGESKAVTERFSPSGSIVSDEALNHFIAAYEQSALLCADGIIDEVRLSGEARSAAWVKATYESGRDDLLAFGSEETLTSNLPTSKNFGNVSENSSYWSKGNGTAPAFPLDDDECFFAVTNNSSVLVDITIKATNFSGGVDWSLASSPGVNIVTLKAGKSGDSAEGDMVTLTTGDQSFISDLSHESPNNTIRWEIKLETGTFTDGVEKTSTITLTATCA